MNREEIIKKRIIKGEYFNGKIYYPSMFVRNNFLKLFTFIYKDFSKYFCIDDLMWDRSQFKINLKDKANKQLVTVYINDNLGKKNCNGKYCTDSICLGNHGNILNKNLLKFLLLVSINGKNIEFSKLLEFIINDPVVKRDYYKIFWKSEVPEFSIIKDWGTYINEFRFFLNEHIVRDLDHSLVFNISEIFLHHSERECLGINPLRDNPKNLYRFFNYADDFHNHSFDPYFYLSDKEKQDLNINYFPERIEEFTDLNDDDVIMGNSNTKLENITDIIVEKTKQNKNIKMVGFNCTCVPRIIGDDIYSVLDKTSKRLDIPFLFQGQLEKTPFEVKVDLLDEEINKLSETKIKKEKNTIALFGYHENQYLKYLNDILLDNGIKLKSIFIPKIDFNLLKPMLESEVFVFSKNSNFEEIFEYPFKDICDNKYLEPKHPFGIENTKNWFKNILNEFNIEYKEKLNIIDIINEYYELVEDVKRSNIRLGFVFLGLQDLQTFLNSNYTNDIDIIDFALEMGFGLDFFIYDNAFDKNYIDKLGFSNGNNELIKKKIEEKLLGNNNFSISFFRNSIDMYDNIKNKEVSLLYSDIYFDERIIKLGINQFNVKNFHLGYIGALETIKELISLSEMKYFNLLNKYIK